MLELQAEMLDIYTLAEEKVQFHGLQPKRSFSPLQTGIMQLIITKNKGPPTTFFADAKKRKRKKNATINTSL
jgi:hypothetical protein